MTEEKNDKINRQTPIMAGIADNSPIVAPKIKEKIIGGNYE